MKCGRKGEFPVEMINGIFDSFEVEVDNRDINTTWLHVKGVRFEVTRIELESWYNGPTSGKLIVSESMKIWLTDADMRYLLDNMDENAEEDEEVGFKIYGRNVMGDLREQADLERNDTSKDQEIMARSADDVWQDLFNWNGLLGSWGNTIKGWVKEVYGVDLDEVNKK